MAAQLQVVTRNDNSPGANARNVIAWGLYWLEHLVVMVISLVFIVDFKPIEVD